jgi:superfamily II DNA/RNA helicase
MYVFASSVHCVKRHVFYYFSRVQVDCISETLRDLEHTTVCCVHNEMDLLERERVTLEFKDGAVSC